MKLAVDRHQRGEAARAEACHHFQAEQAVTRRLARLDLQRALDRVERLVRALHVAGRAAAQLDVKAPERLKAELVVERGDAVHLARGQPQVPPDADDRIAREVAVRPLHVLQQGDQRVAPPRRVSGDDRVEVWSDHRSGCDWSP